MKIPEDTDRPREEWEHLINAWIFNEQDRKMLKMHLLDGVTIEKIAEEFGITTSTAYRRLTKAERNLFKRI